MHTDTPTVLISGCSSGIGHALAKEFAGRDYRVFATARKPAVIKLLKSPNIDVLSLDVTDEKSIGACVDTVIAKAGRIDVLVNNAGILLVGPLVELTPSELRRQFETNVIGLSALIQAAAPHMIKQKAGMIVNISSVSGVLATPFGGAYSATKAAVNALSDALRIELAPFGIRVVTVQPGAVKSNLSDNAAHKLERFKKGPYGPVYHYIKARAHASQKNPTPAEVFAEKLVEMLSRKKPPRLIRIGNGSSLLPLIAKLPRALADARLSKRFGLQRLHPR
jgi:NAD(P)-dependent dehydrogenase (short-subunit alcohol dehydrogenase family)